MTLDIIQTTNCSANKRFTENSSWCRIEQILIMSWSEEQFVLTGIAGWIHRYVRTCLPVAAILFEMSTGQWET